MIFESGTSSLDALVEGHDLLPQPPAGVLAAHQRTQDLRNHAAEMITRRRFIRMARPTAFDDLEIWHGADTHKRSENAKL